MNNKDQAAWEEYRKTLDKPEEMFVGWQNAKGTQFCMGSAKSESPPASVEVLEAVWFFQAPSWKEANKAWNIRNGWAKAA